MIDRMRSQLRIILLIALATLAALSLGCRTRGQTGALTGAGIGALAGQAIGGDTEGTLIGSGVGAGIGYIIGNEMDKSRARDLEHNSRRRSHHHNPGPNHNRNRTPHDEVGPLGGSHWRVIEMSPPGPMRNVESKLLEFGPEGELTTITTFDDGRVEVDRESYRIVDSTLVMNAPDFMVNADYIIEGDRLTIEAPEFQIVATRLD